MKFSVIGPARGMWPDEVRDLTRWVIDNLAVLGGELGLSLVYVDREVALGGFRADIEARDGDGRRVIIENQFGPTDHRHFGQVVVYACEARADVVVWLAADELRARIPAFREEHCRALARLNEVFAGKVAFFGVEVGVRSDPHETGEQWGPLLPRLNVVVRPGGV
jgi:hypothetical protein